MQILHVPLSDVMPLSVPVYPVLQTQSSPPSGPAGLMEMASQGTQDEVPAAPLKVLLGHVEQAAAEALSALYVPTAHSETLVPLPVKPASAKQLPSAAVPELPPVPELAGQAAQAAEPEVSLKVSAAHAEGVTPFGPVYPASA